MINKPSMRPKFILFSSATGMATEISNPDLSIGCPSVQHQHVTYKLDFPKTCSSFACSTCLVNCQYMDLIESYFKV